MDLGLEGQTCIVTGAGRGIGAAAVKLLSDEGARVLLVARNTDELRAVADGCRGGEVAVYAADVAELGSGERIVAACTDRFGPPQVLICSAGTNWVKPLPELTVEDFDRHHRLGVVALFELLQAAVPGMAERGYGRVVNVASIAGKRPSLFNLAYATTKAAQLALARGFADAHASRGVTVNSILPGPVDTGLWTGVLEATAAQRGASVAEITAATRAAVPRGSFADPAEVAAIAVFLCAAQAANVTGAAWTVDGGSVQALY